MSTYNYITFRVSDRIATIMINRPEKRNALNGDVVAELTDAFTRAGQDDAVKVVVLGGEGSVFCAGADLQYIQKLNTYSYEENLADSRALKELFLIIYTLNKVVVARVHGHAIAGGCGLATVCDFIFSVPEAKFGYTEVRIGFLPALVKVFLLRKIGEGWARKLLLTGELVPAEEAYQAGLVTYLVSAEALDESIAAFVNKLIEKNSAMSMQTTKEMIAVIQDMPLDTALEYAAEMNARARETKDCKRGISAFLSREELRW